MNGRVLRRALRGIREHLGFTLMSAGVIACALLLVGVFALVGTQARRLVSSWESDTHVSAYFKAGLPEDARQAAAATLAARPEVAAVDYVDEAEARAWMLERSPELGPVVEGLGPDALPASLEITLRPDQVGQLSAFVAATEAMGLWEELDYGQEWVARFHTFLSLAGLMGSALGLIVLAVTVFLVANTIHLVVHARRDEVEVMRLVGATDGFIAAPFLVEGTVQGLLGAVLGLVGLWVVHQGVLLQAQSLLAIATDGASLPFLGAPTVLLLLLGGLLLGVGGAWTAVRRFLRGIP